MIKIEECKSYLGFKEMMRYEVEYGESPLYTMELLSHEDNKVLLTPIFRLIKYCLVRNHPEFNKDSVVEDFLTENFANLEQLLKLINEGLINGKLIKEGEAEEGNSTPNLEK